VRNKKRLVMPTPPTGVVLSPLRIVTAPAWPGSGHVTTVADTMPMLVIPGMPPRMYPQYVKPLVGYTLATLALTRPQLTDKIWDRKLMLMATIIVATRAGLWAAINRVPELSATDSPSAVRYSARLGKIVMRAPELGDGTETWRCILASCNGMSQDHIGMIPGLLGAAPMQFLLGSALLLQSGEVYALPTVEENLRQYYQSNMSRESWSAMSGRSQTMWDLASAAAIGGLRASVIRGLSTDPAFVLGAHLRTALSASQALESRLSQVLSKSAEIHLGLPEEAQRRRGTDLPTMPGEDTDLADDGASVADTEALGETCEAIDGAETPRAVPPPPMDTESYERLTAAIRAVPAMTPALASVARNMLAEDSIVF